MSLAGPVAVAYAESVVAEQAPPAPTDKFKVFEKEQPKLNKAIKYLRKIYRHRVGKTRVISLNDYSGKN